jgi:hypothetical protein
MFNKNIVKDIESQEDSNETYQENVFNSGDINIHIVFFGSLFVVC